MEKELFKLPFRVGKDFEAGLSGLRRGNYYEVLDGDRNLICSDLSAEEADWIAKKLNRIDQPNNPLKGKAF